MLTIIDTVDAHQIVKSSYSTHKLTMYESMYI